MTKQLSSEDAAWLGGVLSIAGSFSNRDVMRARKWGRTVLYKYELASGPHAETVHRVGRLLDLEVKTVRKNGNEVPIVRIHAPYLHELMRQLWPYLSKHRQHEYAAIKRASDASVFEAEE